MLKIIATFVGTFLQDSTHYAILFLVFSDYLGITAWYWWLGRFASQTRAILRGIVAHFSCLSILLLAVAILGTVSEFWIIAIEVISSYLSFWFNKLTFPDPADIQFDMRNFLAVYLVAGTNGHTFPWSDSIKLITNNKFERYLG
jgi:hypothetical protein